MIPPVSLISLRSFTEVARLGSVKRAAAALGVTPGAVSQQIKALEHRIDAVLFERHNREIRLTIDGARLLGSLSEPFAQIDAAISNFHLRKPHKETLTISTTASFAATWLVPRLGRFQNQHRDIELRIETSARLVDLRREPVDVALRHGGGDYLGLESIRLVMPVLLPVGSPSLLEGGTPINKYEDCLAYPLLQDRDRANWSEWFKSYGVKGVDSLATKGFSFENDLLLLRAVAAGQGLALVRDIYAEDDLAAGRIAIAMQAPLRTTAAYYFVARPETMRMQKVIAFRDWISSEKTIRHISSSG